MEDARGDVFVILIDTLRRDALHTCNPNMPVGEAFGSLARDAIIFDDLRSGTSWTRPAVASLCDSLAPVAADHDPGAGELCEPHLRIWYVWAPESHTEAIDLDLRARLRALGHAEWQPARNARRRGTPWPVLRPASPAAWGDWHRFRGSQEYSVIRHFAVRTSHGMRARSISAIGVLTVLLMANLTGCVGRLSGVVDFDENLDFAKVKTFSFYEDSYPQDRKQTDVRQLIRAAIEQNLRKRGYGFGRTGEADLMIVYHSGNRAKMHFGGTMSTSSREASLSIEFQNPVTRRSAWYGTVGQTWGDNENVAERVDTAVTTLLDRFPPEGSGEIRVRE